MDELVLGMDLDEYAREEKRKTQENEGQDVDGQMDEQGSVLPSYCKYSVNNKQPRCYLV